MDHKSDKVLIDPDYVATNNALKIKAEKDNEENKLTADKLSDCIAEVFDDELNTRQKQLEEVEENIFKAQKLLHLVRYVLITSYYKKNSLEVPLNEEIVTPGYDKQNRIHPAVKKLLGSNPRLDIFCAGKGKRRLARNCDKDGFSSEIPETKKPRLEIKNEPSSNTPPDIEQTYLNNRKKVKHRLIIGNVSKWVPSLEDNTTHKWMMYVRGDKDSPDISHIVEKVIFYLHPSYKPHDVVEVKESPFHLPRRGWGEFPLRVQIFFKCPLNKPISIVHNLKLEKTFTGRQTLGNETIVDVYLHNYDKNVKSETITRPPEDSPSTSSNAFGYSPNILNTFDYPLKIKLENEYTPFDDSLIKTEPKDIEDTSLDNGEIHIKSELHFQPIVKSESFGDSDQMISNIDLVSIRSDSAYGCSDTASMSFEHDYCDVIEEQFVDQETGVKDDLFFNQFLFEHSYSVLSGTENSDNIFENRTETRTVIVNGDIDNKLIFGLGESYLKEKIATVHNVVPKNLLIMQRPMDIQGLLRNGCTDFIKVPEPNYITLPKNKFKNIGEALPYLLNRFKLWRTEEETNNNIRSVYSFIASSQKEFERWPFGRRLNSEWNRAREIKKILAEYFPTLKKWNTRACFMYARSHKYDAVVKTISNFYKNKSCEVSLINECFLNSVKHKIPNTNEGNHEVDVDVESNGESFSSSTQKSTYIDISDPSLKNQCAYIKETALDCGIVLRSEEVSDGVIMNGAERMILEAVKCLAESLLRRANHHLVCRNDYRDGYSGVTRKEVEIALKERSEIQLIKTFQQKKREIDYFR